MKMIIGIAFGGSVLFGIIMILSLIPMSAVDPDLESLSEKEIENCKTALIGNLEQFKKDARLSNANTANSTLLEWNNEFVAHQERFKQILADNRCVNDGDDHLKTEWFTGEFQEKYQKLVDGEL